MRISKVEISGFRGLLGASVPLENFASLIGLNGSGKSSVLYALDWFFNGSELTADDHYLDPTTGPVEKLYVEVTFVELAAGELDRFRLYTRRGAMVVRRSHWLSGEQKLTGNPMQGPRFGGVRSADGKVAIRTAYNELRATVADLPAVTTGDAALTALEAWENDPSNSRHLEEAPESDVSHFFGFNGGNLLSEALKFILVPASKDITESAGDAHRGSVVDALLGALVATSARGASDEWLTEHDEILGEFTELVESVIEEQTSVHETAVNNHLQELIPEATVTFEVSVEMPPFKPSVGVRTVVETNNGQFPLRNHGHGLQRSVLISLLQATEVLRVGTGSDGPTFVLAVEEPEIYQHPVRARAFASSLTRLAETTGWQVVVATHSPYFVAPANFDSARLIRRSVGHVEVIAGSISAVAASGIWTEDKIRQHLERLIPTHVAEAFFAEGAVLVEGVSEKAILDGAAHLLGHDLDQMGIVVVDCGGKENIAIIDALLRQLGVNTFVVFDGDFSEVDPAQTEAVQQNQRNRIAFHASSTERLVSWLVSCAAEDSSTAYQFGDATKSGNSFTIFKEHLNVELATWPSLVRELGALNTDAGSKNPYILRLAVTSADAPDMPACIRHVVESAAAMHRGRP